MTDLEKVKFNGSALEFIEEQTIEICLAAVNENPYSLRYVKQQTEEICLMAVKQNGYALQFVDNQTYEICHEAIKEDPRSIKYVKKQTLELCLKAIRGTNAIKDNMVIFFINKEMIEEVEKALRIECLYDKDLRNKIEERKKQLNSGEEKNKEINDRSLKIIKKYNLEKIFKL